VSTRLNLNGATVLPFQFPALNGRDAPEEALLPPATENPVDTAIDAAIAEAEERAARIDAEIAAARDEGLRRGVEEGRQQGYAAGYIEGVRAGEARMTEALKQMAAIIGKLGMPIAVFEQPVEEAVAALALEVARCVIGDEVKRSHGFLVRLVREAIAKVPLDMGAPRVLLNPSDLDLVRKYAPDIEAGNAVLVADDTVEAGGALVVADGADRQIKDRRWSPRTADGVSQVDLTLSSRWRQVMLGLFDGEEEG
jgi:flagellar assembly protein FliH